jgi:hypothetical protein
MNRESTCIAAAQVSAPGTTPPQWRIVGIRRLARHPIAQAVVASLLSLIPLLIASHGRSTAFNNDVRVAYAWLHGRMWIDYPGKWMDAVLYNGRYYGVDGPMPAVLALPLVLWKGLDANQTALAIGLCAASVGLGWIVLARLGVSFRARAWLSLFLFAGTDLWWCAMLGDVWFLAHVSAVFFTLLVLIELGGRRRGWLVGLLAFAAFESRFTLALALPLYAWLIWSGALAEGERKPRELIPFGAVLGAGAVAWAGYNELMWGTLVDIGHTVYYHQDAYGSPTGSPFGLRYLPYQIYSFFIQGPIFVEWLQVPQWPYFKVDPRGVALTFTSPALILALLAREPRRLVIALWLTTALVAGPSFVYYLNGWYQFGMRHALDFEPFLFVLMGLATRAVMPRFGAALIVYSSLAGAWGVWWWDTFMRTAD